MIAPRRVLGPWSTAEFARKNDKCAVEHASLLQFLQQAGDRLVDRAAQRLMCLHVTVRIPRAIPAARMTNLNEANAVLNQPPRQQQLSAESSVASHQSRKAP